MKLKHIEHEENVNLKYFCTIKVGGKGKILYFPKNIEEVKNILDYYENVFYLGLGSNLIFSDILIERVFINSKNLKKLEMEKDKEYFYINVEAGVSFKTIVSLVKKYNLEGFENLSGIPATVGGAVAMNAGAYGSEIFDIVEGVWWINKKGELVYSKKEEINFSYRYTQFQNEGFVYKVRLRLKESQKDITKLIKEHLLDRNKKQPLNLPTAGSTYKNPKGFFAGKLIEDVGLKGFKIGDIGFSEKHANFLVNYGNAKFKDLIKLLELTEKKVKDEFNINLEREVKIID